MVGDSRSASWLVGAGVRKAWLCGGVLLVVAAMPEEFPPATAAAGWMTAVGVVCAAAAGAAFALFAYGRHSVVRSRLLGVSLVRDPGWRRTGRGGADGTGACRAVGAALGPLAALCVYAAPVLVELVAFTAPTSVSPSTATVIYSSGAALQALATAGLGTAAVAAAVIPPKRTSTTVTVYPDRR